MTDTDQINQVKLWRRILYPTGNGVSQKHERTAREYHTGLQEVTAERIKCCAVSSE